MNSTACGFSMGLVRCPVSITVGFQNPVLLCWSAPFSNSRLRVLQQNSQVAHLLEIANQLPQMLKACQSWTWHLAWNFFDRKNDARAIPTQIQAHTHNPSENCSICWSQFSWYVLKLDWGITRNQLSTHCTKVVLENFNHLVKLCTWDYHEAICDQRDLFSSGTWLCCHALAVHSIWQRNVLGKLVKAVSLRILLPV